MKKGIAVLVTSLSIVSVLAGCGSNNATNEASQKPSTTPAESKNTAVNTANTKKVQLTLWHYYEKDIQDHVKKFNESQNEVEVAPKFVPFSDFKKQLTIGLSAGNLPDLVLMDNPDVAAFAAMGLLEDITDKVSTWADKDQFFEGPMKSGTYQGKNYALPFVSNCLAMFYNTELLDKAGVKPPQTWDELKTTAKLLTKDGVSGFATSLAKGEEGTFNFYPWLMTAGGDPNKLDSAEAVNAVNLLSGLIKEGSMSREVINVGMSDIEKQFAAGKVAMMINGPWQTSSIQKDNPNLKFNIALIPKGQKGGSVLGGEDIGIVKGKNADAAWKFLSWAGSADAIRTYTKASGAFPPRKDVAADKTYTDDPSLKVWMEQMQFAMPRGPHPKWPELSTALSASVQAVVTGTKSTENALKEAQATVDKLMK
ncbi:sugar ABC transporter substrate-binding protein [Paenibacillus periandrae]|uniref:sugar ABC transporter substrate-binding protein n=1 Tax=Paenibacillus periandrae TaxID=1761741 RepID=UPI001F09E374|nr:ABC transporter substrate-binding protein [Paenibacillus periandrae]